MVFIDQNVSELALVGGGNIRKSPEQIDGLGNQVVEVKSVVAAQLGLVALENFDQHPLHRVAQVGVARERLGVGELILGIRNHGCGPGRRQLVNVGTEVANDSLENRTAVAGVIDREVRVVAKAVCFAAKNRDAGRVKGLDPHARGLVADEVLDSLAHLGRCLIGEGDGKNLARPEFFVRQEVRDAASQHRGLARTGAGHDQQRRPPMQNGLLLLRV